MRKILSYKQLARFCQLKTRLSALNAVWAETIFDDVVKIRRRKLAINGTLQDHLRKVALTPAAMSSLAELEYRHE